MRIVEYKTVVGEDTVGLDVEVTKLLSHGYQLYGSPYVRGNTVAQALIKHGLRDPNSPVETVQASIVAP